MRSIDRGGEEWQYRSGSDRAPTPVLPGFRFSATFFFFLCEYIALTEEGFKQLLYSHRGDPDADPHP